jgi:flavin reductase (DIM6/NTAB) family NADH-FMN oxidoreductase RutF
MFDKKVSAGLHLIANGVYVIAAQHGGQTRGFTATWVMQISYDHPLIMASVGKAHHTYPLIAGSNKFYVNILGASQVELAQHFGKPKDPTETDAPYFREENGNRLPILTDAVAYLECNVVGTYDAKDHILFIA